MKKIYQQPYSKVIKLITKDSFLITTSSMEVHTDTRGDGTTLSRRRTWLDDEEE